MVWSLQRSNIHEHYLFCQELGREHSCLKSYICYVFQEVCFSFASVLHKTFTHIPKVSSDGVTGAIKCLQVHNSPSVTTAETQVVQMDAAEAKISWL